jgi:hypothetical protein
MKLSPKKFRAYYKPDAYTKDGLLRFDVVGELGHVLQWEANIDSFISYPFFVPFTDTDWEVHQCVATTSTGIDLYEKDVIRVKLSQYTLEHHHISDPYRRTDLENDEIEGIIYWNENSKGFCIRSSDDEVYEFSEIVIDTAKILRLGMDIFLTEEDKSN